jgi:integrase
VTPRPATGQVVERTGKDGRVYRSLRYRFAGQRRERTLGRRANENLGERELPPLTRLTPHSLRRTFASVLYAVGEDPGIAADELGHTDPTFTFRVYRQAMRRDQHQKAQLRALVEGVDWANMGERDANPAPAEAASAPKSADLQALRP